MISQIADLLIPSFSRSNFIAVLLLHLGHFNTAQYNIYNRKQIDFFIPSINYICIL